MARIFSLALLAAVVSTGCYSLPDKPHPFVGDAATDDDSGNTGDGPSDNTGDDDTSTTDRDSESGTSDSDTPAPEATCADGILCWDPPKECDDETHIRIFAEKGTCFEGANGPECNYEQLGSEPCEPGLCRAGVCMDNPCRGVHCNLPDAPYCSDDQTLNAWNAEEGTCVEQDGKPECVFVMNQITCDDECVPGEAGTGARCSSHVCSGISTYCTQIPADYCDVNADGEAWQWSFPMGVGIAEDGACRCVYRRLDYPETELDPMTGIACDLGCDEGTGKCRRSGE